MFSALIKGVSKNEPPETFLEQWYFIRQGEWWLLNGIKKQVNK